MIAMRQHEQRPTNPSQEMPGDVYIIPDKHWRITTNSTEHPGVCIKYNEEQREVVLCKGTSATNIPEYYQDCYTIIEPKEKNGLSKGTAFFHQPQIMRLHKVLLYYPERHIGSLDQEDLKNMLHTLALTIKPAIQNAIQKRKNALEPAF